MRLQLSSKQPLAHRRSSCYSKCFQLRQTPCARVGHARKAACVPAAAPLGGRADKKPKRGRAAARGEAPAPEDMAFDAPPEQPEPRPGGGGDAAPAPMDLDMKIVHEPIIATKVIGI